MKWIIAVISGSTLDGMGEPNSFILTMDKLQTNISAALFTSSTVFMATTKATAHTVLEFNYGHDTHPSKGAWSSHRFLVTGGSR